MEQLTPVEKIEKEIADLELRRKRLKNMEQAIKVAINSVYGCIGSPYFIAYNQNVAEAITLQAQHINNFMAERMNSYFMEHWHKDRATHKALGITVSGNVDKEIIIYMDTDSQFINFEDIIATTDWTGDNVEFILKLYEVRLAEYIQKCLDIYAKKWGTNVENKQNLELEHIAARGLWVAGKNYVEDIVWEDPGIRYDPGSNIISKGLETAKASVSRFVRGRLPTIISYIFDNARDLDIKDLIARLKKLKNEFKLANVEDICPSIAVNDYDKWVLEDKTRLAFKIGATHQAKASGWYNHLLNQNEKLRRKYRFIKAGDRVHIYVANVLGKKDIEFAFLPGEFPIEMAPDVDYDEMFSKYFLGPVNRMIVAIGKPAISDSLVVTRTLF